MKTAPSLVAAAALLALSLQSPGASSAGGQSYSLSKRAGRTDAEKLTDQRAAAERWLDDRDEWNEWGDERERHREIREVAWRASTPSLTVDGGRNGGAIVIGWGRDSVHVVGRVQADAGSLERARELARGVRLVVEGGRISAEGPETGDGESWSVTFDVLAPRTRQLQVEAHNGPVCVADMDARMDLETVNGPIVLKGVAGDVRASTQNGPLTVSLTGSRWRGAGLDASTRNGPVALAVPRGYSCMLETGTINGPMRVDIPITIQGSINLRHDHVTAKLGSGGPRVRAVTTNGPAVVAYVGAGGSEEVEH